MVIFVKSLISMGHSALRSTSSISRVLNTRAIVITAHRKNTIFSRTLEHGDRKVVGAPMEIMYDVVSDVDKYYQFIPYCTKSVITSKTKKTAKAQLSVGFGPVKEHYNSTLVLNRPSYVKSICTEGRLFNLLDCTWKFSPGPKPDTCIVNFHVIFEFRSLMYTKLATMFFNEVVKKMVTSFETRAILQNKRLNHMVKEDLC